MAVTPNIGKLIDTELLKVFKTQQDTAFDAKLDEKENVGTAAKLVGTLASLTTTAKGNAVAAINEVKTKADNANTAAANAKSAADKAQAAAEAAQKTADNISSAGIGDKTTLKTTEKTTIVGAINEVVETVATNKTAAAVTVDFDDSSRVYKISQGGTLLGTMNIGKDLVVSSGEVKEVTGKGTCIVLTLTSGDVIEIPAASLIDIYTAQASATEVQVAIDATKKVISASLVNGGIAKTKLATAVQTSLGKADSALQAANIASGKTNGTIAVKGTDVAVTGLKDAAYATKASILSDAATAAETAIDTKISTFNTNTVTPIKTTADAAKATADKLDGAATVAGSVKKQIADAKTSIKADVKKDTDALGTRVTALETWKGTVGLATEADILAMFA